MNAGLAIMFGAWVFIVHAPRVAATPANADKWSRLLIALACCSASWIMRENLARGDRWQEQATPA